MNVTREHAAVESETARMRARMAWGSSLERAGEARASDQVCRGAI